MTEAAVRKRQATAPSPDLGTLSADNLNREIEGLSEYERRTGIRLGPDKELKRIRHKAITDLCQTDADEALVAFLGTLTVFGRRPETNEVLFTSNVSDDIGCLDVWLTLFRRWFDETSRKRGPWRFTGFVNSSGDILWPVRGGHIYSERENKSENARAYLDRMYADELAKGKLTLSDLRKRDPSLWRGLRNWAHAGGHNLDDVIPRGKTAPGPAHAELGFDPGQLDPSNPKDALLLRGLKARENSRKTSAAYRRRKQANIPS